MDLIIEHIENIRKGCRVRRLQQDKGRHALSHLPGQALVCTSFLLETACLVGEIEPALFPRKAAEKRDFYARYLRRWDLSRHILDDGTG